MNGSTVLVAALVTAFLALTVTAAAGVPPRGRVYATLFAVCVVVATLSLDGAR